jgi:uncharacterized membrane protein YhiD involved in acid resistance
LNSLTDRLIVEGSVDFPEFILMLLIVVILSGILMKHYEKYFPFVSRSQGMSKTLIAIPIITCLVITIVKSSLALSLGLVGALSIVRFRTPIKEPYELAYIFAAIAIGLGLGAGQALTTIIAVSTLLVVMTYLSRNSSKTSDSRFFIYINTMVSDENKTPSDTLENVMILFEGIGMDIDIRRLDNVNGVENIALAVNIRSSQEISKLNENLNLTFPNADISIVDGQRVVPF